MSVYNFTFKICFEVLTGMEEPVNVIDIITFKVFHSQ